MLPQAGKRTKFTVCPRAALRKSLIVRMISDVYALSFGRRAKRIALWLATHFFHEDCQAVNGGLHEIDAFFECVIFGLALMPVRFDRFI